MSSAMSNDGQSKESLQSSVNHVVDISEFPIRMIVPDIYGGTTRLKLSRSAKPSHRLNLPKSGYAGQFFDCGYSSNAKGQKAPYPLKSTEMSYIDPENGEIVTFKWTVKSSRNAGFEAVSKFDSERFHIDSNVGCTRESESMKLGDDPEGDQEYQQIESKPESSDEEDMGSDDINNTRCGWRLVDTPKQ